MKRIKALISNQRFVRKIRLKHGQSEVKKARFFTLFLQNRKSVNVGYAEMMTGTLQTNVVHGITNNKK